MFRTGVHVRIYHPLPWLTKAYRWSRRGGGWIYKFMLFFLNINRRDHRKLCVVDEETAWVGSFNISANHLPADSEVCLLLPEQSDVAVFPGLSSHYYRELLRAGARIFLYQRGVMHAKALLVDEFAIIGSSNWNFRSTLHDLELDVVIRDGNTLQALEKIMRADGEQSRELQLEQTPKPNLLSWLVYALRYWM